MAVEVAVIGVVVVAVVAVVGVTALRRYGVTALRRWEYKLTSQALLAFTRRDRRWYPVSHRPSN